MNHTNVDISLPALREQSHPECFVCGPSNGHGLGLEFRVAHDGVVEASFPCERIFAGYPGMLHGGVICMLLDGAMTNCLFARGLATVTVDMNVRFRHPVMVSRTALVRAWLESDESPVHRLAAELRQDRRVVATAKARFVKKEAESWFKQRAS